MYDAGVGGFRFKWDESYNRTNEFMQALPYSYKREKRRAMRHFGIDTIVDLQMRISSGIVGPGLTPKYLDWKKKHGFNSGHLLRTTDYRYNIKIDHTEDGFFIYPTGMAQPNPSSGTVDNMGLRHLSSNAVPYERVAAALEYGDKFQQPRPHWMPTARRARGRFPSVMRKVLEAAFQRARSSAPSGVSPNRFSGQIETFGEPDSDYGGE